MRSIELFAGAGGLALGVSAAGFAHEAVIELDRDSCDTIRENQRRGIRPVRSWPLFEADVTEFDFKPYAGIDLVAGGPPCQPFSIGGKAKGHVDRRNLFPEVVRAVRDTQPQAILIENVKGLLRPKFARYFEYILLQLSYPTIAPKPAEDWREHLARLEQHHTKGRLRDLTYQVVFDCLNAANYGVPQRRERVFFVGFRKDLGIEWSFPRPTHTHDALLRSQWVTGDYWERHQIQECTCPDKWRGRVERLRGGLLFESDMPWRTVRDAISDLPDPTKGENDFPNHVYNPGARTYAGHTGSPLDEPAKTLKAGDHGVPGGENMLAYPNGEVRYFTVRESARLQTFPDDFVFAASWTESMRQVGNAVAVKMARLLASSIKAELARKRRLDKALQSSGQA
ncbi:MAG: DNA cytosine methyltransferase [Planctomycetaceae bacterium]|nr:DNA cytosine methyltransferase [Planctomycetaceae bacterium]